MNFEKIKEICERRKEQDRKMMSFIAENLEQADPELKEALKVQKEAACILVDIACLPIGG